MKHQLLFVFLILSFTLFSLEKGLCQTQSPQTYAVVVGISDYQDESIPDLSYADKDALAFAGFLQSSIGGALDEDHIKVLINEKATAAQFAIALDWLWEVVKENDQVIVYFAGHGDVERKSVTQPGYLLCWDAPARVYLAGGAIALPMFQDAISTLSLQNKAKVIVIADACRSGNLSGSAVGGAQLTSSNLAKQYANEIKILSCQPDEYSIEGEQWGGGRGAFSYHLLNGLIGLADDNHDEVVDLKEIGRYLEDYVTEEVAPESQNPMIIGNKTSRIADVFPEFLAEYKDKQKGQMQMFAATVSRGIEDDVLAAADSSIVEMYFAFKESLADKNFLEPANACSDFYYEILSQEPQLKKLHSSMRRNYAAALQDDAQQVMNKWLKSDISEMVLSKITQVAKYEPYPRYLKRATQLLGKGHYMYSVLMARKLYIEGYLLSLRHHNPDKELGLAALKKFKRALFHQPNMPHAYLSMSRVFGYNLMQPDSMEYYAIRATEQAPSWLAAPTSTAFILSNNYKEYDRSLYYLEKADQIDSNSVLVVHHWGIYYQKTRRFEQAEKHFIKTIQLDSTMTSAYNNLAVVYKNTRRYEEAEKYFLKTIQLDSTFTFAYNNLGTIYHMTKHYDKAEEQYKKALLKDSTFFQVNNNLGNIYRVTERYEKAEKYFLRAIKGDSTYSNAYNSLGVVYNTTQRYDEAEECFKNAILFDSTKWTAFANLGHLHQNFQRWEESAEMLLNAIKFGPPIWELRGTLGNAYTHIPQRKEDAKNELDKVVEMSPDSPDTYIYLAQWFIMNNQQEEAWQYLERGLEKGIGNGQLKLSDLQEGPDFAEMRKDEKWNELIQKYIPK